MYHVRGDYEKSDIGVFGIDVFREYSLGGVHYY
jgi:hypothetical protein